jgi:hypothetical protein
VTLFIGTLFREWDKEINNNDVNVIIVTHGLTLRLFLMRWYLFTVEDFERSSNPSNCQLIVMNRIVSRAEEKFEYFKCNEDDMKSLGLDKTTERRGDDMKLFLRNINSQDVLGAFDGKFDKFMQGKTEIS